MNCKKASQKSHLEDLSLLNSKFFNVIWLMRFLVKEKKNPVLVTPGFEFASDFRDLRIVSPRKRRPNVYKL